MFNSSLGQVSRLLQPFVEGACFAMTVQGKTLMQGFAHIQLIGYTGKEPELSYTTDGLAMLKFSVAVRTGSKEKHTTTWYTCTAWRTHAERLHTHLKKGQPIFLQGDLTPRPYTTRDGTPGVSLDVTVEHCHFLGTAHEHESPPIDKHLPRQEPLL